MGRTMKHNGFNANRGFKQLAGVARRAHKFIKGAPDYLRKIDNYAGRGADVLTKGGQVLSLAGAVTGNEGLMKTGDKMVSTGGSIQNYRSKAHRVANIAQNIMGEPV